MITCSIISVAYFQFISKRGGGMIGVQKYFVIKTKRLKSIENPLKNKKLTLFLLTLWGSGVARGGNGPCHFIRMKNLLQIDDFKYLVGFYDNHFIIFYLGVKNCYNNKIIEYFFLISWFCSLPLILKFWLRHCCWIQ